MSKFDGKLGESPNTLNTQSLSLDAQRVAPGPLRLLIAGEQGVSTVNLTEGGTITIGRGPECEVVLDDDLRVSRRHAVIFVGAQIEISDLGSTNGTKVGERTLPPNERVVIDTGDAVTIGTTVLVLQSATAPKRPRRLLDHGYFEMQLEEECARADASGTKFAILRVLIATKPKSGQIEQVLDASLRPMDVLACYAPDEFEILLIGMDEAEAEATARKIRERMEKLGGSVRIGSAIYPSSGRTPEDLVARAGRMIRPDVPSDSRGMKALEEGAMARLEPMIRKVAQGMINVIILGETGVGKEVMAESLHALSPRAAQPLLRLNCAALAESLMESELFGHEKGAFTGAHNAKPGLLETAQGGTVFLDEVGEMPISLQAKLLRVLEERKVMRVGAIKPRPIDVRFIAATNRDLETEAESGRFRADLFYRLNGISLVIPPLRERLDEIDNLVDAFITSAAKQVGAATPPRLSSEALDLLKRYSWPGNIRELKNVVERAVLLCEGVIELRHLPAEKMGRTLQAAPSPRRPYPPSAMEIPRRHDSPDPAMHEMSPRDSTEKIDTASQVRIERDRIISALDECAGNQTRAAKMLGISRRTLVSRLEQFSLPRPRKPTIS